MPEPENTPEPSSEPTPPTPTNAEFQLKMARDSYMMLIEFRDAVDAAQFPGSHAKWVAMGLNFLENMINQSHAQLEVMKRLAREGKKAENLAVTAPTNGNA